MSASEIELKSQAGQIFALVRSEIERFADGLSAEEKNRRGSLQQWSATFMLVHLTFWESHFACVFENGLAGKSVPDSGSYLNQLNDGVLYEHLDQLFAEARADEATAYNKFLDFFEREVSPHALADPQPLDYLKGYTLLNRMLRSYAFHPVLHLSNYYVENGHPEQAAEVQQNLSQVLEQLPLYKDEAFYKLAAYDALSGWPERALLELRKAVNENPKVRTRARADTAFEALRGKAEFEQIVSHP
jgi:hypothetical protein